jgi:hypothetical protein
MLLGVARFTILSHDLFCNSSRTLMFNKAILTERGRLSKNDLLIEVACYVKKENKNELI